MNALVEKKIKKALHGKKKKRRHDELHEFENLDISDGEKTSASANSSSSSSLSSSDSEWKTGSNELFSLDKIKHSRKKIKLHNEKFSTLDSCLNAHFQYESLRSRLASQNKTKKHKEPLSEDLVPIVFGTLLPTGKDTKNKPKNKKNTYVLKQNMSHTSNPNKAGQSTYVKKPKLNYNFRSYIIRPTFLLSST